MNTGELLNPSFDGEINLGQLTTLMGIYFLYNDNNLLYIGRSTNIVSRVLKHLSNNPGLFNRVKYKIVPIDELISEEGNFIKELNPPMNTIHTAETTIKYGRLNISISLTPVVTYLRSDRTYTLRFRVICRRNIFYIPTNYRVPYESVKKNKIIDKDIIKVIDNLLDPIRKAVIEINADEPFEIVKQKIMDVAYIKQKTIILNHANV